MIGVVMGHGAILSISDSARTSLLQQALQTSSDFQTHQNPCEAHRALGTIQLKAFYTIKSLFNDPDSSDDLFNEYTTRYSRYSSHPGLGGEASPHVGTPRWLCSALSFSHQHERGKMS
jgi:hypothetical protein